MDWARNSIKNIEKSNCSGQIKDKEIRGRKCKFTNKKLIKDKYKKVNLKANIKKGFQYKFLFNSGKKKHFEGNGINKIEYIFA